MIEITVLWLPTGPWTGTSTSTIRAGSHGVPSPNREAKSELSNLKETFNYGCISLKPDIDYYMQEQPLDSG